MRFRSPKVGRSFAESFGMVGEISSVGDELVATTTRDGSHLGDIFEAYFVDCLDAGKVVDFAVPEDGCIRWIVPVGFVAGNLLEFCGDRAVRSTYRRGSSVPS